MGTPHVEVTTCNFSGIDYMQWSCIHDIPRMSTSTQFASIAATARLYAAVVIVTFTEIIMLYAHSAGKTRDRRDLASAE